MFDIHAHLHDGAFDADRDEVVGRALDAGVTKIITIGTDTLESRKAVACVEKYEGVYASVGIHPDFFNEEYRIWNREYSEEKKIQEGIDIQHSTFDILSKEKEEIQNLVTDLKKIAQSSRKVVAIGECGLDYFVHQETESSEQRTMNSEQGTESSEQRTKNKEQRTREIADAPLAVGQLAETAVCDQPIISEEQKKIQREGFIAQIELAEELKLPLIIHCRPSAGTVDAYEDVFEIFQTSLVSQLPVTSYQLPIILHCYMGDTEVTEKFLELPNVYFSFTGNITYPVKKVLVGTRNDLTEVVKMIPIERMLAETDCPYLAPVPHRGKRNEPAFVTEVVAKIAEIKGVSREAVEQTVTTSAKQIFEI